MSGGYLMPDGNIVLDLGQSTSPAEVAATSPCGQASILAKLDLIKENKVTTSEVTDLETQPE